MLKYRAYSQTDRKKIRDLGRKSREEGTRFYRLGKKKYMVENLRSLIGWEREEYKRTNDGNILQEITGSTFHRARRVFNGPGGGINKLGEIYSTTILPKTRTS